MAKTKAGGVKRKRSKASVIMTGLLLIGLLLAALPTAILFVVGMVPTVVSLIVDTTPGKYACRCVAGLNLAGVAPFIEKLWEGRNSMDQAMGIISDPFAWLVIYMAAGAGWLLFLGLPSVTSSFMNLNAQRKVESLRDSQQKLIREWGRSVMGKHLEAEAAPKAEDEAAAAPAT